MSRMTSSSANANNNHTSKILTDFSIDTIIGGRRLADHKSQLHRGRKSNQTVVRANPPASSSSTNGSQHNHFNANLVPPPPPPHQVASSTNSARKYRPKNFQCPACKMAFSNNGQLKNHVRIHTGERPFRCNQPDCNKTFTRNEELTRHKLIHTGVRPHSCTSCGKRFGRKDHLKKHVRTHDRKKLRKKVFVPTSATHQAYLKEDVFAPPKSVRLSPSATDLINLPPQPPVTVTPTLKHELANGSLPINATSISIMDHLQNQYRNSSALTTQATTTTMAPAHLTTTASSAIQQLANDYWNKWYNFLGLYHPQPYPNVNRLNDGLYRR